MILVSPPPLEPGNIHIWLAALDRSSDEQEELAQSLSPDEQQRAARLLSSRLGSHFTAGRGILRTILSAYLSIHPTEILFKYGPQGKPYLDHPDQEKLLFNLSHSGEYIHIAVAPDNELGIDIEKIKPIDNLGAITRRFFSQQESQAISALPEEGQTDAFFACWTRKEAFIKACGGGLAIPLDSFSVSLETTEHEPVFAHAPDAHTQPGWRIIPLSSPQGYTGALSIQGKHDLCHFTLPA